jgi:hypothetical protein
MGQKKTNKMEKFLERTLTMNSFLLIMALVPLISVFGSAGDEPKVEQKPSTASSNPTIVIHYVPLYNEKPLWSMLPQLEYLKIPDFPPELLSEAQGWVFSHIITDGHKATLIDVGSGWHDHYMDDLEESGDDDDNHQKYYDELGKYYEEREEPTFAPVLENLVKESIKTWRFREHKPEILSTFWHFVRGRMVDNEKDIKDIDVGWPYEILNNDTTTFSLPYKVEVVTFPDSDTDPVTSSPATNNLSSSSPANFPQVEYLKIPAYPPWPPCIETEVVMKVKTDGEKIVAVEVLNFVNPVFGDTSVENVKTWQFKKHKPTEFITRWKYNRESCLEYKPNIITLKLPFEVDIKSFSMPNIDPVVVNKYKIRKQPK